MAAELVGCSKSRIIFRHMVPSFISHIIAATTLAIPAIIISETSLSFLGLGLRPPAISWGVLLQDAQNIQALVHFSVAPVPVRCRHRRGPRVQFHGRRDTRCGRSLPVDAHARTARQAAAFGPESADQLLPGRGNDQGRRRRFVRRLAGKDARHRRRERLRQERHCAVDPADRRSSRAHRRRRDRPDPRRRIANRPGQARRQRPRDALDSRRRHRPRLPGADDVVQSRAHDRRAAHRGGHACTTRSARRKRGAGASKRCAASASRSRSAASTSTRSS